MGHNGVMGRIVELFNGKKNGFFIECGAVDGGFCQLNIFERLPSITIERLPFITIERLQSITIERLPSITIAFFQVRG